MTPEATTESASSKAVVSEAEAAAIIAAYAPAVQILEVVSDFYADLDSIEYHQTHEVPGFFQISTDRFEAAPLWNLRSDDTMIRALESYAITLDSGIQILIYDNIQISCGQATSRFDASARIYSVLKYFGVKHVSIIMDNAMNAQFQEEYAANHHEIVRRLSSTGTETSIELASPARRSAPGASNAGDDPELMARSAATFLRTTQIKTGQHAAVTKYLCDTATGCLTHPAPVQWSGDMLALAPLERDVFVSYETMVKLLAGELGPYRLLDARSAEEHAGTVTGYEYVAASGRIPTSESVVNAHYQLSVDNCLSDVLGRLEQCLRGKGIRKDDRIIWYCGTGWRAARMCALTQLLGYTNAAIYEGGWNEWYQRNPRAAVNGGDIGA